MYLETKGFSIALLGIILIFLSCKPFPVPSTPEKSLSKPDEIIFPTESPVPPSTELPAQTGLNTTGPYISFEGNEGVWIINPDGSFPTQISEQEIDGDIRRAISPDGGRIAFVASDNQGLELVIRKIPGGDKEKIIRRIDIKPEEEVVTDTTASNSKAFVATAIRRYDNVAWQPESGRMELPRFSGDLWAFGNWGTIMQGFLPIG